MARYLPVKAGGIFYASGFVQLVECDKRGAKLRKVDDDCELLATRPVIRAEVTKGGQKKTLTFSVDDG